MCKPFCYPNLFPNQSISIFFRQDKTGTSFHFKADLNFQENLIFSLAGFSSGVAIATTTDALTVTTRILQQWTTLLIITSLMATI